MLKKHLNVSKAFTRYWNYMNDNYRNLEGYNANEKRKILKVFDDMIVDILSKKKNLTYILFLLHNLVLQCQKILDKILRINLLWKFQESKNFSKLQLIIHQILTLKTLWIFTKNVLWNHILFVFIDFTLTPDNLLHFRKNLLEKI